MEWSDHRQSRVFDDDDRQHSPLEKAAVSLNVLVIEVQSAAVSEITFR
jgi:hypothetical protein